MKPRWCIGFNYVIQESHDSAWKSANKRAKNDPQMITFSIVNMAKAGGATHDVINYIHQSQQMEAFCAG